MKQEQNCAVWSWNYPGFPSPDGESIVIPMGPPLGSLGTGTCNICKPILLQSFQHFSSRVPERVEMGFPSKILEKVNNKNDLKDSADFIVNPSKFPSIQTRAPCPAARRATSQTVQTTFAFLLSHTWYKQGAKPKDRLHQLPFLSTGNLPSQQDDLNISHSKALLGWDRTSGLGSLAEKNRSKREHLK